MIAISGTQYFHTLGEQMRTRWLLQTSKQGMSRPSWAKTRYISVETKHGVTGCSTPGLTHAASAKATRQSLPSPSDQCFAGTAMQLDVMFTCQMSLANPWWLTKADRLRELRWVCYRDSMHWELQLFDSGFFSKDPESKPANIAYNYDAKTLLVMRLHLVDEQWITAMPQWVWYSVAILPSYSTLLILYPSPAAEKKLIWYDGSQTQSLKLADLFVVLPETRKARLWNQVKLYSLVHKIRLCGKIFEEENNI